MKLIDIHSHLNFPDFDSDREEVIQKLKKEGIATITVGTNLQTSREAVALAERYEHLWATVGIHPHEASETYDSVELLELTKHPKTVAIGECGLDYFKLADESLKHKQKELFLAQIEIARQVGKPLMLHIREAYEKVLAILEQNKDIKAHAHFFAGDWEVAKKFLALGHTLSVTGVITFTTDYDEVIKNIPLDRLMIETDAPYVAPVPYRGKRCEPAYVKYVAKRIAEIKGLTFNEVAQVTSQNTKRVFNLQNQTFNVWF
ncbi:MAG: TatD family hydrolase [Candidatus Vogelbacteria bacterium]|nr:TatD family hydrolase [Candidatus Vogelbacteria bacterium]